MKIKKQALAYLAVFVYATQAIAFEWKPGLTGSAAAAHTELTSGQSVKSPVGSAAFTTDQASLNELRSGTRTAEVRRLQSSDGSTKLFHLATGKLQSRT